MKKFRKYVLTAAGFVVLAAVISGIAAGPAIAQAAKAALVHEVGVTSVLTDTFVTSTATISANNPSITLDTSGAKTIRLSVHVGSCQGGQPVQVEVYSNNIQMDLMTINCGFPPDPTTAASRVYEVPATQLLLRFANLGAGSSNDVHVVALARTN